MGNDQNIPQNMRRGIDMEVYALICTYTLYTWSTIITTHHDPLAVAWVIILTNNVGDIQ